MTDERVLVVGIDAACFEQVDPLIEAGALPNLAELLSTGVGAPMETTTPPWTPSAWPSVVTGARPWTHGVYDFHHYGEDEPSHVTAREVKVPFLWEVLSTAGHRSIVVNVPVTHPVHVFDGSLVPGYIAPEGTDCLLDGGRVPMATLDEEYRIYPRSGEERVPEYRRLVASRAEMAARLADEHPWSFMMVQFQSTDAVFHSKGDDAEAIRHVYEAVDGAIGRLRDLAGEDAHVFVVSDHGMHRYERVFHCNTWLRDRGLLETAEDTTRWTWNERTRAELTGETAERGTLEVVLAGSIDVLSQIGVTPRRVERLLARVGLDDTVARLLPESVLMDAVESSDHVDWERSRAYCRSCSSLGIRCNVANRDPGGVVPREEFDALRERLVAELRTVTDPDGDPVFERVYDRHRVHGSDVANEQSAPDVVVRPADMVCEVSDVLRERTFARTSEYNHSSRGLFAAAGSRIVEADIDPHVVDVVPTILALFGLAPPASTDGHVLDVVEPLPGASSTPDVGDREFLGRETSGVSDTVEAQLREMGYVE